MNEDRSITFIIPAYNAEKYLERAVQSITMQNMHGVDWEVIIVENGSLDDTWNVAQKLAAQNEGVKVCKSEPGVSFARNKGLEAASGSWIAFVDADDYLLSNSLNKMLRDVTGDYADLFIYGHEAGNRRRGIVFEKRLYEGAHLEECRIEILENPTRYMQVWGKLFRRDIIMAHKVCFNTELFLAEDSDFTLKYSRYCKSICFLPDIVYHYSTDNVSTMRLYDEKKIYGYIHAMTETGKLVEDDTFEIQHAYAKYVLMHLNISMVREVFSNENKRSFSVKLRQMKKIIHSKVFFDALKSVRARECTTVRMLPILMMKCHWNVGAGLIYCMRAWQNHRNECAGEK